MLCRLPRKKGITRPTLPNAEPCKLQFQCLGQDVPTGTMADKKVMGIINHSAIGSEACSTRETFMLYSENLATRAWCRQSVALDGHLLVLFG